MILLMLLIVPERRDLLGPIPRLDYSPIQSLRHGDRNGNTTTKHNSLTKKIFFDHLSLALARCHLAQKESNVLLCLYCNKWLTSVHQSVDEIHSFLGGIFLFCPTVKTPPRMTNDYEKWDIFVPCLSLVTQSQTIQAHLVSP
jgi:hypothetical protein